MKGRAIKFGKNKYIMAAIALILVLTVGISFCLWDTTSVSKLMSGGTANMKGGYQLVEDKYKDDNKTVGTNGIVNVGDIVTYGRYYQTSAATTKDPLRWIVVDRKNGELTLLAERVLANGGFFSSFYYNKEGKGVNDLPWNGYYQNYSVSTVRMWLNSDFGKRADGKDKLDPLSEKVAFRGFASEAFSTQEVNNIIKKEIAGIVGFELNKSTDFTIVDTEKYPSVNDKVWLPRYSEIYGTFESDFGAVKDATSVKQFSYFKGVDYKVANADLIAKTTSFASTPYKSSYISLNDTSHINNSGTVPLGTVAPRGWMTLTPHPSDQRQIFYISSVGKAIGYYVDNAYQGGLRPGITIPE